MYWRYRTFARICAVVVIALFFSIPALPAFAADYYHDVFAGIYTSSPNTTIVDSNFIRGSLDMTITITSAVVKFLLQPGDQISVNWYDQNESLISTSALSTSSSPITVTPPANTYAAKLAITTSSEAGDRWVWWSSYTNSLGDTQHYADPDTTPPPSSTTVDLTPVVNELQTIQGQLTTIQGQLNTIISNGSGTGGDISSVVSAINSQTAEINSRFDEVTSQLSSIRGQLTTIQGQLNTLDSHVVNIYDYLSTPRTAQPFQVNMPAMTVDPTPPPITEPPQQPYKYERNLPQMPPFEDSPGPLPLAPDPKAMEHDPPREISPPVAIQQPRERDPVQIEPPRTQDPVIRQEPRAITPVTREAPRQIDNPIQPAQPIVRENPLQPQAPLAPQPPLTPQPPL